MLLLFKSKSTTREVHRIFHFSICEALSLFHLFLSSSLKGRRIPGSGFMLSFPVEKIMNCTATSFNTDLIKALTSCLIYSFLYINTFCSSNCRISFQRMTCYLLLEYTDWYNNCYFQRPLQASSWIRRPTFPKVDLEEGEI